MENNASNIKTKEIFDIKKIINNLKGKRNIFISERDFQLSLAQSIISCYPQARVRLEYCPAFNKNWHIDVLVLWPSNGQTKWIPIELKYKTKKLKKEYVDKDNCSYLLKNQGAQDYGCYDYIKDIYRIEQIKKKKPDLFLSGYAIFLTNDMFYPNGNVSNKTCYYQFRIKQRRNINGTLEWQKTKDGTTPKTGNRRKSSIKIIGNYKMIWEEYTDTPTKFMVLINEISQDHNIPPRK